MPNTNPSKKTHYPLPRTKLTSLVKGEVLSPERIRATTGGIVFLLHPFRFSDTSVNNPSIVGSASHCNRSSPLHKGAKGDSALQTLPKPHFPSKSTISLPPLSKGGGLTAKHKLLPCRFLLAIYPPFYSPNFSAVKTEGLSHQPFKNRTIPPTFRRARVCVCFFGFASVRNFGHTRLRHPCLFMNALLALRPAKPLGVHFRHPCLARTSRCIEVLIFSAFLIYQSSIADCNQFFILIY